MSVAQIILSQLGGNKFIAMTGARNLMSGEKSLTFSITGTKNKSNRVRIELASDDTYTVTFARVYNCKFNPIEQVSGVYCDNLQEIFTDRTGLLTSL